MYWQEKYKLYLLVPGEKITKESIEQIQKYLDSEIKVHGLTEDGKIQWD